METALTPQGKSYAKVYKCKLVPLRDQGSFVRTHRTQQSTICHGACFIKSASICTEVQKRRALQVSFPGRQQLLP